jgi:hypothetical protein
VVISKKMRWTEHVTPVTDMRIAYKILFVETGGRRPIGRPRCRWENYFIIKENGYENVDWVCLLQHKDKWRALVHMIMNCDVA